jgi:uncharacterized membrane protein YccC
METAFDYLTIGCLAALVIVYFFLTKHEIRTLMHLMISAAAFAIANQLGNAGLTLFAAILMVAGVAYAALVVQKGY